jgi:FlaA1/EpsC-like NDP-sugar epimerase
MKIFEGKTLLITGGTGSLGQVLVRRLLSAEMGLPKKIMILSRDEAKQHDMRIKYLQKSKSTDEIIYTNFSRVLEFHIGDMRSIDTLAPLVRKANVVINAAALKQVPTCEYFPAEALKTNCMGAQNIVDLIRGQYEVPELVIGVSTDKACHPVNVMGITKALQERIFVAGAVHAPKTRFALVRYGNVLASRGSVVPLFHEQLKRDKVLTVTDQRMTRFLMSLEQAVDTIFAAAQSAKTGEIYIPKMPATSIYNLALALIEGTGNKNKAKIEITGIRPGEKLHEVLIAEEEVPRAYSAGNYYAVRPMLPELLGESMSAASPLTAEYSSRDSNLDLGSTVDLLRANGLLILDSSNANLELIR